MGIRKKAVVAGIVSATMLGTLGWLYIEQLNDQHEALVADQLEVVKAARNIPHGTPLTKDRITTEKVPRKFLPPHPLLESELNLYLGTPVAADIEEGAMLLTSDFSIATTDSRLMVIKSANLTIEHASPAKVSQQALTLVAKSGGFVSSSSLTVDRRLGDESFQMVARVPTAKFETVVMETRAIGDPVRETVRGAGVAEDVHRLEAKLGNTQLVEHALAKELTSVRDDQRRSDGRSSAIEIVRGDAGGTTTVVQTGSTAQHGGTGQLAKDLVEAQKEGLEIEVKLRELDQQMAYATIEISISRPRPEVAPYVAPTFGERLGRALERGVIHLEDGILLIVRGFAFLLPFAILGGPLLVAGAVWLGRRRRRLGVIDS